MRHVQQQDLRHLRGMRWVHTRGMPYYVMRWVATIANISPCIPASLPLHLTLIERKMPAQPKEQDAGMGYTKGTLPG